MNWHVATRPRDIARMPEAQAKSRVDQKEPREAGNRADEEHPTRVIDRQFRLLKERFRGQRKNAAHLLTLFAQSNL